MSRNRLKTDSTTAPDEVRVSRGKVYGMCSTPSLAQTPGVGQPNQPRKAADEASNAQTTRKSQPRRMLQGWSLAAWPTRHEPSSYRIEALDFLKPTKDANVNCFLEPHHDVVGQFSFMVYMTVELGKDQPLRMRRRQPDKELHEPLDFLTGFAKPATRDPVLGPGGLCSLMARRGRKGARGR